MRAAIKPRINEAGRTRLEAVIPLSTPFVLFVDPASVCNYRCRFCPTGDRQRIRESERWQGFMSFDLFKTVIDSLADFEAPIKVLRLYKDGEPFLNPRFADMVRYAKASGYVESIDTTTNGSLLDERTVKPVLDAGIDRINISVNGLSSEQFEAFTGRPTDFDRYVSNLARLYDIKGDCEICIKTTGDFLSSEEKARFYARFGDIADRIFIENMAPCWPDFEVGKKLDVAFERGIYDQPIGDVSTCPYIFYSISINSDGTVSLCFLDWARKLIIGDVRNARLKSIWDGAALKRHRVFHLQKKRRQHPVCGDCGQLTHCAPDNIDPYAEVLLERIEET